MATPKLLLCAVTTALAGTTINTALADVCNPCEVQHITSRTHVWLLHKRGFASPLLMSWTVIPETRERQGPAVSRPVISSILFCGFLC
jgi:hypothetical protein